MEELFKPKKYSEVIDQINNFVKVYPNGKVRLFTYNKSFNKIKPIYELHRQGVTASSSKSGTHNESTLQRSLRRSKTVISDIVLSNDFDMFATFTFKKDRQNKELCKTKMQNWLNNQQKRTGKFQYLIVPEFHKDGKSLHFHALFNNYKGKLIETGVLINTRKSYNIKSYTLGFTSVVKIDNKEKVANYVKKYITKDMPRFEGKKRYWASTKLKKPTLLYNVDVAGYRTDEIFSTENFSISEGEVIASTASEGK